MKIPSITELLDSPQLKPWVDRASRNVVVSSVKTFVERVATDLQSRAAEMNMPSVGELAERIAEWMARRQASTPHAQINATGILLPEHASLPLAEEALHALHGSVRDYVTNRGSGPEGLREISSLARQLCGAEAALVTANHSGAMLLALAASCVDRPVVVARRQVGEIDPGVTLPQTARCAGVTLRECGIVERVRTQDYEEALSGAGAILVMAHPRFARAGDDTAALLGEIASLAKRQNLPLIVDLGLGGVVDPARYQLPHILHARQALELGADLVIVSGDRLLGGPPCGFVVGREAAVERLRKHHLYPALAASPLLLLPLAATLELQQDAEVAERTVPLLSMMATSSDNLKSRAERLAPQLSSYALVESAAAEETVSHLAEYEGAATLPSWQVVLKPRNLTAAALAERLATGLPSIAATVVNDRLTLNLRTVLPRQDMQIVEGFDRLAAKDQAAAEQPPG